MKKIKTFILGFILGISLIAIPIIAKENLASKLQGKILLAVEDRGKTYYVHNDGNRYRVDKDTAHTIFEKLALGITNENLEKIPLKDVGINPENNELAECLIGVQSCNASRDECNIKLKIDNFFENEFNRTEKELEEYKSKFIDLEGKVMRSNSCRQEIQEIDERIKKELQEQINRLEKLKNQ